MKKIFLQGIVAGILAAIAAIIYFKIYQDTLVTKFDSIVNVGPIIISSITGCLLMSTGYFILLKMKKENWRGALNLLIAVLSFASILGPLSMTLPLNTENPELFPGLVIPMHFFPALAFFAISPFYNKGYIA